MRQIANPRTVGVYRVIHDEEMQRKRQVRALPCGPRGVIQDYISFYFGPRSPMLLRLQTGRVQGYTGDQTPIMYLVSSVERIRELGVPFIFSNGHGVAYFTGWFDNETDLHKVDWDSSMPEDGTTHWKIWIVNAGSRLNSLSTAIVRGMPSRRLRW
jgi:hypothetical protein